MCQNPSVCEYIPCVKTSGGGSIMIILWSTNIRTAAAIIVSWSPLLRLILLASTRHVAQSHTRFITCFCLCLHDPHSPLVHGLEHLDDTAHPVCRVVTLNTTFGIIAVTTVAKQHDCALIGAFGSVRIEITNADLQEDCVHFGTPLHTSRSSCHAAGRFMDEIPSRKGRAEPEGPEI